MFIDEYTEYASNLCAAPPIFHRMVAYAIIGIALKNRVFYRHGINKIHTNIWLTLLAPSSAYHKSTAINTGLQILNRAVPGLIYPSEFSHEKIIEILQERPQGTFVFLEFLSLMGLLNRDYMAATKSFLTELWDIPEWYERETKGTSLIIEEPVISILSATTLQWFLEQLKETDLLGGFLPRFIFLPCKERVIDKSRPPAVDEIKRKELAFRLGEMVNIGEHNEMTMSEMAGKLYDEWYRKYSNGQQEHSRSSALTVKSDIYLIKFAMILEIAETGSSIISEKSMREAIINIDWINNSIVSLMDADVSFSKFEAQKKKIIRLIKAKEGLARSEILRGAHVSSQFLNQILQTLIEDNSIIMKSSKENGDDKPTTRFFTKANSQ